MKFGKDTNITLNLGTLLSIVFTAFSVAGLYYSMATEDYVDMRIKEALQQQIEPVALKTENNKEQLHQVDKAIGLLSKSVENHDKNMEAFTAAIKQLGDDIRELYKRP